MELEIADGDLLEQEAEAIVNAWNRNIIPWWLLLPAGVSGAIKARGGYAPFRELSGKGPIPAGGAVITGAGRLPFRAIIHVAGIDLSWRSSEKIIRACVSNALSLAADRGFSSIAFPLIGSGTGGFPTERALEIMRDEASRSSFGGRVLLVRHSPSRDCYCGLWEKKPAHLESKGVPRGYCGLCERCGRPGHTRHFPGAVPYTGSWCDYHYRLLSVVHPLGFPGGAIYAALAAALLAAAYCFSN